MHLSDQSSGARPLSEGQGLGRTTRTGTGAGMGGTTTLDGLRWIGAGVLAG